MKTVFWLVLVLSFLSPLRAGTLSLERTIPLPGVEGRLDHFALDVPGARLFVAALGNNSVEVVDLATGKRIRSIQGLSEPQGICYLDELNRLYVANGGDGCLKAFDGNSFALLASVSTDDDADNVRYDRAAKLLYVGHGNGQLGAIDVSRNELVSEIPLTAHPESFQLEEHSSRAYVNVPNAHHVAVIDRKTASIIATWPVGSAGANFPMALDEPNHRLMIACRLPSRLLILDSESGKEIARLDLHGDCDDLFYDPARRQIYASCGEGFIDSFTQKDANHYAYKDSTATEPRARTCCFDGEHLYLAVPRQAERSACIQCYRLR